MDAGPVLELIDAAVPERGFTFVGIGGRGGSGKTTLAALVPGAQVVGTDEFWDGDRFDLERLLQRVFDPLAGAREARYASWDWDARRPGGERRVTPEGIVVVEGVCALPGCSATPTTCTRLGRGAVRDPARARRGADGEAARATWVERWMPMEDAYVERDDPVACAHVVIDGS